VKDPGIRRRRQHELAFTYDHPPVKPLRGIPASAIMERKDASLCAWLCRERSSRRNRSVRAVLGNVQFGRHTRSRLSGPGSGGAVGDYVVVTRRLRHQPRGRRGSPTHA
jgi:hypothetical protein